MLIKFYNRSHILVFFNCYLKKSYDYNCEKKIIKMLNFVDRNCECIHLFIIHIISYNL